MNYNIFDRRETDFRPMDGESAQAYMERLFTAACNEDAGQNRINDMLAPRLRACDAAKPMLMLEFGPQDWMLNSKSTLHGGIISTALDMTMGMLSRYCKGAEDVSTVTLHVRFLRAGAAMRPFCVRAAADKVGHRVIFQHAALTDAETGEVIADAEATFM